MIINARSHLQNCQMVYSILYIIVQYIKFSVHQDLRVLP